MVPDNSGVDLNGLDVVSMSVDYTAMITQQGVSAAAALRSYRSIIQPLMRAVIIESARAALDFEPDVLVAHPKILSAGLVADALSIPHIRVEIVPALTPTSAFPAAGTITRDLGRFNRSTYRLASAGEEMFRRDLKDVSRMVGSSTRSPTPPASTLMPISPALLHRPANWDDTVHMTGPWKLDGPEIVSPEVAEFMAEGNFVYAGFGSMAAGNPHARAREVIGGIRAAGFRGLLATGLGGLEVPSELRDDDILVTDAVAHAAVLPEAAAAVHHGGIGTVHAATAAGAVSVLVPFIADQPFWAERLREKGLAADPIPQRKLTADRLSAALGAAEDFRPRVRAAADTMAHEDGTGSALRIIEGLA
ncbi:glycosyltransferase [Nesterenkonia sp. AY15]|uniref:glycosyltransferase n=1 Tax=Nesterenkonia sp. AY15 TaxID=2901139 RepID=UPI001F4C6C41|nr:glycosyltransferase [Nesterenkonia sp. AY15]